MVFSLYRLYSTPDIHAQAHTKGFFQDHHDRRQTDTRINTRRPTQSRALLISVVIYDNPLHRLHTKKGMVRVYKHIICICWCHAQTASERDPLHSLRQARYKAVLCNARDLFRACHTNWAITCHFGTLRAKVFCALAILCSYVTIRSLSASENSDSLPFAIITTHM